MKWLSAFLLLLCLCLPAQAEPAHFDWDDFAQIPVVSEGRIQPLDSLARVSLKRIYGQTAYQNLSPDEWLAFVLFTPREAMRARMFLIALPRSASVFGLEARPDHLYSFEEIAAHLPARADYIRGLAQKEKGVLGREEEEAVRVFTITNDFAELIGTFSLLLPLSGVDDAMRGQAGIPAGTQVTYSDLLKNRQTLVDKLRQSPDPAVKRLVERVVLQERLDQDNMLVRLIPPSWQSDEWLAPWAVVKSSSGSPHNADLFRNWRTLAISYRAQDALTWNKMSHELRMQSLAVMEPFSRERLGTEYYYHRFQLLELATACYALALLLLLMRGAALRAGNAVLFIGTALHGVALMMRMFILMRPPVGTLYESLIFVSFTVLAVSYWLGKARSSRTLLLAGTAGALLLLLAAQTFAGQGDTLGVLVAVLNTNFWLATHVICITTGYGCALVAGLIAHLYLYRYAVRGARQETLVPMGRLLHQAALIALLFTAVGTMLGGIWADQSWGRFWGWDPKENGALLIVLWLMWLLHGRIAGQLGALSFAALMALVNIVVAVAWVGVNLLSVGLHSYGFTDEAAMGLLVFCALEFVYVAVMLAVSRFKREDMPRMAFKR